MKIDPQKDYSLLDIVKLGILGKSHQAVARAINWDRWGGENVLKVKITGRNKGARYKIKGVNLLKYIEMLNANSI